MAQISKTSLKDLIDLQDSIVRQVRECVTLEDAAQQYMSILYNTFNESIVLARLFATIPFKKLPESNREFVIQLGKSAGISKLINNETLIMSLLGSKGTKPEWNDRRKSIGHVGVPLVSENFIDRIPMMSRLLKQLGFEIECINVNDTKIVAKSFENLSGVFYVQDAGTEVDNKGRKIIAAQDFVKAENIKSVFGVGGCYLGTSLFFSTIVFVREFLEKDLVERFILQANKFKTATMGIVTEDKIFA